MSSKTDRDMAKYTDMFGYIGHLDKEGALTDFGDSAQRTNAYLILTESLKRPRYNNYNDPFEPTRHWNHLYWTGRRGSMSRDNITPILIQNCLFSSLKFPNLAGLLREVESLRFFRQIVIKRGGFLWNTHRIDGSRKPWWQPPDWIGLRNIATVIRGSKSGKLWKSLVFLLDAAFFLQCCLQVVKSWFERPGRWYTSDDLNLYLECSLHDRTYHTPFTRLGRWVYKKRLPAGDDNGRFKNIPGYLSPWFSYFRHESAPPLFKYVKELP